MLTCSHMCHLPAVEFDSSGHLLRELRPDVAPVVRAEVTAAHASIGDALDANTLLRGYRATALLLGFAPLTYCRRRYRKRLRKSSLTSHDLNRSHDRSAV